MPKTEPKNVVPGVQYFVCDESGGKNKGVFPYDFDPGEVLGRWDWAVFDTREEAEAYQESLYRHASEK